MSIARHTLYNIGGAIVPILVSLVTVPLYLNVIGLDRYGILAICWLLVGYFNLFDFGLGKAVSQKIATLDGAPAAERSRIFWTSAALSLLLSLIAMLLFLPIATLGLKFMQVSNPVIRTEFHAASHILLLAVPLGIFQGLLTGALEGRQEFLKINFVLVFGTMASTLLPLLTAYYITLELSALLITTLLSRILVIFFLFVLCVRAVPLKRPALASSVELGALLRFGGLTAISNIVGPIMVFVDRFAIGALLSTAAVALYVVPFNLVSQLAVVPVALSSALFPRLAGASSEEAVTLSFDAIRVLLLVLTPLTVVIGIGAGPFLQFWIGHENGQLATPVALVLLFGFWANSLARVPYVGLLAAGRPGVIAKLHLAEIVPYLSLLYLGMRYFGLPGAALAWSVRSALDALMLMMLSKVDRAAFRLTMLHALIILVVIGTSAAVSVDYGSRWFYQLPIVIALAYLLIYKLPTLLRELSVRLPFLKSRWGH